MGYIRELVWKIQYLVALLELVDSTRSCPISRLSSEVILLLFVEVHGYLAVTSGSFLFQG